MAIVDLISEMAANGSCEYDIYKSGENAAKADLGAAVTKRRHHSPPLCKT